MFSLYLTVKTVDFYNQCNSGATSVILGMCQAALHIGLQAQLLSLIQRHCFSSFLRYLPAATRLQGLGSGYLIAALLDRFASSRVIAVACVTNTRVMAITHCLLVVSSLPPAPFLPPLSVQMEWISDEC